MKEKFNFLKIDKWRLLIFKDIEKFFENFPFVKIFNNKTKDLKRMKNGS